MSNELTKSELQEIESEKAETRRYSSEDLTVFWRPAKCIHSANCLVGLPGVFNAQKRPWINIDNAGTGDIISTVDTCPSRALTYLRKSGIPAPDPEKSNALPRVRVQILKDGPALVSGDYILLDASKQPIPVQTEVAAICRCGASGKKPFCDGSHMRIKFKD